MTRRRAGAGAAGEPLSPALDRTFKIGLVLKGLDGILEVAGGILLLFLSPHAIERTVRGLTAHERSEDPHDVIARYLLHSTSHLGAGGPVAYSDSRMPVETAALVRSVPG